MKVKKLYLSKQVKKYTKGWVAVDEKNAKIVAHAASFDAIMKKTEAKTDVVVFPASESYFVI